MSHVFLSGFAERLQELLEQREVRGYSIYDRRFRLANFDRFCEANFPMATTLTQEIAFAWCNSAQGNAGCKRSVVIRDFGRFLRAVGDEAFIMPTNFFAAQKPALPYICSGSELKNFFEATDRVQSDSRSPVLEYTIPVIFRLIYACGMRPQEARQLRRIDVDCSAGTIYIAGGKHYKDRRLAVDGHIVGLCKKYNRIAETANPGRSYFFQSPSGGAYSSCWLSDSFSKCWAMSGNGEKRSNCVPYSLRHSYATETLTRWLEEGRDLDAWITYLSAYMGHESFSSTYYYVHLIPGRFAKMEYMHTGHIIPEVTDYDRTNASIVFD